MRRSKISNLSKSGWYTFNITDLVKNWINEIRGVGGFTFYRGFALKASATGVSSKHFCSANYSGSLTPSLSINFTPPSVYYINDIYDPNPLKAWGKLYVNEIPPLIKFDVDTAGVYVFETMNSSYLTEWDFTASDTKLVLYNSTFTRLAQNEDISSTNKFSRIEKTLQTGTYYLTIINQDPSTTAVNCYLILEGFLPGGNANGELLSANSIFADRLTDFYKVGDQASYNCFDFALDYDGFFANPNNFSVSDAGAYEYKKVDLISQMEELDHENIPNYISNCIIAYSRSYEDLVRHFAISVNGKFYAKLGTDELVMHLSVNVYSDSSYGVPYLFFEL